MNVQQRRCGNPEQARVRGSAAPAKPTGSISIGKRAGAFSVAGLLLCACVGEFSGPSDLASGSSAGTGGSPSIGSGGNGGNGGNSGGGGSVSRPPSETGFDPEDEAASDRPAITTRVARLTHSQWRNSIVDLLHLDGSADYTDLLREDPRQGGFLFDNDGSALVVDGALLDGYERAAAELAARVSQDGAAVNVLAPQGGDPVARRDAFIERFITRAHRHTPSTADVTLYRGLFDAGPTLYEGMGAFEAGVRAVVEAALQSPFFLYRVEQSSDVSFDVIPLDGYEVAVRLSYALWNTMPDDALFAAARDGELTRADGVEAQATRMLSDDRAADVLLSFHGQLLEVSKFASIRPSSTFYDVSDQLGAHATTEQNMFIEDVLFDSEGSLKDLLTSTDTYVNEELAGIYGLSGSFDESFRKVELDSQTRAGIFTHVGFLAANATSVDPDPIHRGKFLAERMNCLPISAPPVNVPPPPRVSDKTNRERIEEYTEDLSTECAGCHKPLINPFGFPFENFDAIGALRSTDQGKPVRTDAQPFLDGAATPVADGVDLAHAMAAAESVHSCYAEHALEFIYGRKKTATDESLVERLARLSLDDDLSVRALLLGLVKTEAFMTRSTEEE